MTRPDDSPLPHPEVPAEFGAAYWENRYRSGPGASKRSPSPSLVAAAGGLQPGRALDAGCGVGGDALWLAARGWDVTAADISATALAEGRRTAAVAGPELAARIAWIAADLTRWEPDAPGFDLVTSHYVHVPGSPETLFRRLASWVAPGGVLLVVGHDAEHGHGTIKSDGPPPSAQIGVREVITGLDDDEWDVLVAEPREHTMTRPDHGEPVILYDVVVHARRRRGL